MRVGYMKKNKFRVKTEEKHQLVSLGAEKIVKEESQSSNKWKKWPKFRELLTECHPGDTLIITSLLVLGEDSVQWLSICDELLKRRIGLTIADVPSVGVADLAQVLRLLASNKSGTNGLKVITVSQETTEEKKYKAFTRYRRGRKIYWQLFYSQFMGESLRRSATHYHVSQATVYRIREEMKRVKHILWLSSTFLVTLVTLQIARLSSDNSLLQFFIGGIATASIIYFTYSDMKTES